MIRHCDPVVRLLIEWRRQVAAHQEKRLKDLADRLPEPLGSVLHARGAPGKAASPGRAAAKPTVVEAAHQQVGERNAGQDA
ncbi:hypothetical protein D3C72_2342210 [compost metagenome]